MDAGHDRRQQQRRGSRRYAPGAAVPQRPARGERNHHLPEPISLAAGASKRVRIYVVQDTTGATITARIVQNGRVVVYQDSVGNGTTTSLIAVLSDQASSLDEFAAIHPAGVAARVVHLRADEIADSPIPLRAFDLIAIDDL